MKTLSAKQPWAGLIAIGLKDIENRDWRTSVRGTILIHASKNRDEEAFAAIRAGKHPVTGEPFTIPAGDEGAIEVSGGIMAMVELVDCVDQSESPWFVGRYGFQLKNAVPLPLKPCRGMPGFFEGQHEEAVDVH